MRDLKWRKFKQTAGIVLSTVPISMIIITNIWILSIAGKYTRKQTGRGGPKRSAVTMVACICWTFLLSWAPYLTIWICSLCYIRVPKIYVTIAEHAITINAVVNPVIYTATNNTFRVFLTNLVRNRGRIERCDWKQAGFRKTKLKSCRGDIGRGGGSLSTRTESLKIVRHHQRDGTRLKFLTNPHDGTRGDVTSPSKSAEGRGSEENGLELSLLTK